MNSPRTAKSKLLLVLILSIPCFGWGRDGHKITGTIATHYLTPEAEVAVKELVGVCFQRLRRATGSRPQFDSSIALRT